MYLKVIAYARNGHTDKFGIPRQSREDSPILTRIVFEPKFAVKEALRGIEGYSHLWLLWGFSELCSLTADAVGPSNDCKTADAVGLSWSPTVLPPRLGGNKRMGVFATRSPFRPNPIGLSSVRLIKVAYPRQCSTDGHRQSDRAELFTREGKGDRLELIVSGADVLDGTPIYDIKPYLSFSDSHPEAKNGFAEETKDYRLEVDWSLVNDSRMARECLVNGSEKSDKFKRDVEYVLSQDPRPAYQDDAEREYKLDYAGYTVTFVVNGQKVIVKNIKFSGTPIK